MRFWQTSQKKLAGYLFVLPAVLFIFSFMLYPLLDSLYMSVHKYNFVYDKEPKFVGLGNYVTAFSDRDFLVALSNTFIFAFFYVIFVMTISLILALLIFQKIRLSRERHVHHDNYE